MIFVALVMSWLGICVAVYLAARRGDYKRGFSAGRIAGLKSAERIMAAGEERPWVGTHKDIGRLIGAVVVWTYRVKGGGVPDSAVGTAEGLVMGVFGNRNLRLHASEQDQRLILEAVVRWAALELGVEVEAARRGEEAA